MSDKQQASKPRKSTRARGRKQEEAQPDGKATPNIVARLKDVARHFAVSERTVQNWRDRGMPGALGKFELAAIAAWREREFGDTSDEEDARGYWATRREKAAALRDELRLRAARGELVPVDVPAREFGAHLVEARALLEQLADYVLAALPKLPAAERRRVLEVVRKRIAGVMTALREGLERRAGELEEAHDA